MDTDFVVGRTSGGTVVEFVLNIDTYDGSTEYTTDPKMARLFRGEEWANVWDRPGMKLMEPTPVPFVPEYRYRLTCQNASSAKYGPCEVCHQSASEVYHQIEEVSYDDDGFKEWTQYQCRNLFGHASCLMANRRGA